MLTSVTLPDGTAAVVHTASLGWGALTIDRYGLPVLYRNVLDELHADASCAAVREHDGGVLVESLPGGGPGVLAYALALCTAPECRALAERCEKELGGPHPDLDYERAWASKQTAGDQDEREMVQEYLSAEVQDVNLYWLQRVDPDAARIFRLGCFTGLFNSAHPVPGYEDFDLGKALQRYAAAKHAEDRMDRYGALFAGTADAYARLVAEEKAVHRWLREHGRTVPAPFGERA
ncbi:hypothetical protein Srubr_26290 [Streptomyces rubradiris]|uniref:Uncharacterized protein n=2 Tax=Streptomyces rubradiris TaxID=285531 RepID=A0ABQ3RA91_STRRR|nr:hypothetical protein Srubr_26290 [Streptomyces rubradiris]